MKLDVFLGKNTVPQKEWNDLYNTKNLKCRKELMPLQVSNYIKISKNNQNIKKYIHIKCIQLFSLSLFAK